MATSALFLGWDRARSGKEAAAIELFQSALAFYGKAVEDGTIESFEPVMLDLHGGDLNGFILVRGEADKLAAWAATDGFRDLLIKADMLVNGIGVVRGFLNEGLQREMARAMAHIPR
jgi:hypothetical protein